LKSTVFMNPALRAAYTRPQNEQRKDAAPARRVRETATFARFSLRQSSPID
jgi:hypothetical protein